MQLTEFATQKRTQGTEESATATSYTWVPRSEKEDEIALNTTTEKTDETNKAPGFTWKNLPTHDDGKEKYHTSVEETWSEKIIRKKRSRHAKKDKNDTPLVLEKENPNMYLNTGPKISR